MSQPNFEIIESKLMREDKLRTNRRTISANKKHLKLYALQRAHVFSYLDLKIIINNTSKLDRVDRDMLVNHQYSTIITQKTGLKITSFSYFGQ